MSLSTLTNQIALTQKTRSRYNQRDYLPLVSRNYYIQFMYYEKFIKAIIQLLFRLRMLKCTGEQLKFYIIWLSVRKFIFSYDIYLATFSFICTYNQGSHTYIYRKPTQDINTILFPPFSNAIEVQHIKTLYVYLIYHIFNYLYFYDFYIYKIIFQRQWYRKYQQPKITKIIRVILFVWFSNASILSILKKTFILKFKVLVKVQVQVQKIRAKQKLLLITITIHYKSSGTVIQKFIFSGKLQMLADRIL
eukprot:TRINITY_DN11561_c0_g2_i1.p1 TRINITY_DN11561_c0_g2~~TRINITY_DN11561_c0_g2_i1.p1  ORF type:complete len:248 (+),score=-23.35 TRINITY_DN11561_c0_g2_i1:122-865(+)